MAKRIEANSGPKDHSPVNSRKLQIGVTAVTNPSTTTPPMAVMSRTAS
jgi:hypothetical protein